MPIESYVLGFDPGKNGGYCILNDKGGIFDMQPMPPVEKLKEMAVWCNDPSRTVAVVIENVTPNDKWRLKSCWTFAQHVGQLHTIFSNVHLVYPRTWQAAMWRKGLLGDAKAKSFQTAMCYLPDRAVFIAAGCRSIHDGMVDAYLIARYYQAHKKIIEAQKAIKPTVKPRTKK